MQVGSGPQRAPARAAESAPARADPWRVADLAAKFAIGVGASRKGHDRLQRAGWFTRQPNPADRRSWLLVLTEQGAHLVRAAEVTVTECVGELIGGALNADQTSARPPVEGWVESGEKSFTPLV